MKPDFHFGMRSLCAGTAAAALAGRGRRGAFRREEGKKKKAINAGEYWQRGDRS